MRSAIIWVDSMRCSVEIQNNSQLQPRRLEVFFREGTTNDPFTMREFCKFELPLNHLSHALDTVDKTIKVAQPNRRLSAGTLHITVSKCPLPKDFIERKKSDTRRSLLYHIGRISSFNEVHPGVNFRPNIRIQHGGSLLHAAIYLGDAKAVEKLLNLGADTEVESRNQKPLPFAMELRDRARVKLTHVRGHKTNHAAIQVKSNMVAEFNRIVKLIETAQKNGPRRSIVASES